MALCSWILIARSLGRTHMPYVSLLILSIYLKEPILPPQMKNKNSPSGSTATVFLFILINNVKHLWMPVTLQVAVMLTRAPAPASAALGSELKPYMFPAMHVHHHMHGPRTLLPSICK